MHFYILRYADIPIMCRTHGQSATPSTVGKELANFVFRISRQLEMCKSVKILGKFNGATGNLNAHTVAFPEKDWLGISQDFVEGLGIFELNKRKLFLNFLFEIFRGILTQHKSSLTTALQIFAFYYQY